MRPAADAPSPLEARRDRAPGPLTHPPVDASGPEQEAQPQARPPRHGEEGAAGQHVQDRLVDPEDALGVHEQLEERGLVVLVDEPEQRRRAAGHRALVAAEPPGTEIPAGQGTEDGLGGQLPAAQGDENAPEKMGSTKATASPTATKRSPTTGVLVYAKLLARWTGVTRVAPASPSAT